MIIVARNHKDNYFYRARLTDFEYDENLNGLKGTVCFIDTGRTQKCQLSDIFQFVQSVEQSHLPPRCFQCRLAQIQPITTNISCGYMWDRVAIDLFNELTAKNDVIAEVKKKTLNHLNAAF